MRNVIFHVFSDRFVVESTEGLTRVPSTSRDAGIATRSPEDFAGEYEKQSQSPGFETGGVCSRQVGIRKMGFSLPSLELSRNAATGFFSNAFHSFPASLVEPVSRAAYVSVLGKLEGIHRSVADKETTSALNRGGLKLHRWNWTLPTLWRYRRNYRKLNTHTGSRAAYIQVRAHVEHRRQLAVLNFRTVDYLARCPETQF